MVRGKSTPTEESTPPSQPRTTPPEYAQPGHDFTLQAIMELKGSVHELISEVRRLSVDMKSTSEKVDALRIRFAWVTGASAVIGALAAAVFALLRFAPPNWFGH